VLIGDDDGMNRTPIGWPIAERAVTWARSILIHAAAGEIVHYETAILAAEMVHRVLIIECGTATLDAWIELILSARHRPISFSRVKGVHPIPLDRSRMQ
jgi:hypothetical protein